MVVLSTGQQTPGIIRLLKQNEFFSFSRLSSNCGQLLRFWHFPGPPSAVVHANGADSLFMSSSVDDCCNCCWTDGTGVEVTIVCLSGNATPRTKGAILSVTLRPGKEKFISESLCTSKKQNWNCFYVLW